MKNKKIVLKIGALATLALPISILVACGSSSTSSSTSTDSKETDSREANRKEITNFIENGVPTKYVSSDKNYEDTYLKRGFGAPGHGIEPFGIWGNVTKQKYDYGTIADSIGYNYGYLQTGKLFMIAYYHKNYNKLKNGDIRKSLKRIGDLISDIIKTKNNNMDKKLKLVGPQDEQEKIKNALKLFNLDDVLLSNPKNLTMYDYLGLKHLDSVFVQPRYTMSNPSEADAANKKAVLEYVGKYFSDLPYKLYQDFLSHTVEENEELAYAYNEVFGYTWDYRDAILGDRKSPSPSLTKNWFHEPKAADHFQDVSNSRVDNGHEDVINKSANKDGKSGYNDKLFQLTPYTFIPYYNAYSGEINSTSARGINVIDEGSPRYDKDLNVVSGKKTERHLEFGLFDSVSLTVNGVKETFDSDANDLNDAKSINGKVFHDMVNNQKISNISFHIREDKKWIDGETGNLTNNEITSEDFWYSIQNKSYSGAGPRNEVINAGGKEVESTQNNPPRSSVTKAIEEYISKSKLNRNSFSPPSKTDLVSKPYYISSYPTAYGIKPIDDSLETKKKFAPSKYNISFDFQEDADSSKTSLFWNRFFGSPSTNNLFAMPSQKIKESLNKQKEILKAAGLASEFDPEKPVIKYAVYFKYLYENISDYQFAGKYYLASSNESSVSWKRNDNYADPRWNNKKNTIETWTDVNIKRGGSFVNILKDEYINGKSVSMSLSGPELEGWKQEVLKKSKEEKEKIGLSFIKAQTSQGDVGDWFFTLALPFDYVSPESGKYFYNNNFAKVFYGATIKELWERPTIEKMVETLYYGHGLEFRSSIQSAINGTALIHSTRKNSQASGSNHGPEAVIPGTGTPKTIYDSKVFNRAAFGKNFVEVTKEDYREAEKTQEGRSIYLLKGEELRKLKENIANAIEEAGVNGKIKFELPLSYGSSNTVPMATYLDNYQKALNSLNDKISVVANLEPIEYLKDE
ncbi:MAG: hypothetical protein HRT99_00825 [Mycoplasmatales bacterium]|nr:hypothetical protein [Mycoplasmatales bacterium]